MVDILVASPDRRGAVNRGIVRGSEREETSVWGLVWSWLVGKWFEPRKPDEDWPIYALGESALIVLFLGRGPGTRRGHSAGDERPPAWR